MSLDWITTPVSAEAPAGTDLWIADDPAYNEYYFPALERIDISYVKPSNFDDSITVFSAADVKLKSEVKSIDALLKSTRDLRLLSLRARWGILAHDLAACVVSVSAMADLLEEMPDAVHPTTEDGFADRLEPLNDLAHQDTVLQPLRYLPLGGTSTTYRLVRVARGDATATDDEQDLELGELLGELSYAKEDVEVTRKGLKDFRAALGRITKAVTAGPKPGFDGLESLLDEILSLLNDAVPDQAAASEPAEDTAHDAEAMADVSSDATLGADTGQPVAMRPKTVIKDHAEAGARLRAVELYFSTYEPSSAALLLVTQARMLVGKSLIHAFEVLMPETARQASIRFSSESGFRLDHAALSDLSLQTQGLTSAAVVAAEAEESPASDASAPAEEPPAQEEEVYEMPKRSIDEILEGMHGDSPSTPSAPAPAPTPAPPRPAAVAPIVRASSDAGDVDPEMETLAAGFAMTTSQEASSQLQDVAAYFNATERSSPIPMLVARARGFIGKDFESLVREFLPKQE